LRTEDGSLLNLLIFTIACIEGTGLTTDLPDYPSLHCSLLTKASNGFLTP
jgi:hypothetical protein